jgi:hypothetical protein
VISFFAGGRAFLLGVLRFPQVFWMVFGGEGCGGWVVESWFLRARFLGLKIFLILGLSWAGRGKGKKQRQ